MGGKPTSQLSWGFYEKISFTFRSAVACATCCGVRCRHANQRTRVRNLYWSGSHFRLRGANPEYTGGAVRDTSPSGLSAQPFGSTGKYATSGPSDGIGTLSLSAFGDIDWISFIWGSIDTHNTLEVLNAGGGIITSFTGSSVIAAANGDQSSPATNRLVKLTFTDADRTAVDSLRFRSTSNAFEFDKVAVAAAVPEPTTWMLMLMGMAGIGFTMRRKRDTTLRVRFA